MRAAFIKCGSLLAERTAAESEEWQVLNFQIIESQGNIAFKS
jgi:hypothetical protein